LGIGDLGIGDWGLGIGPNPHPQSPIPNPQSPIPNKLKCNGYKKIIKKIFNNLNKSKILFIIL
jgi:hypothetical protein